jgi:hypothetical protein
LSFTNDDVLYIEHTRGWSTSIKNQEKLMRMRMQVAVLAVMIGGYASLLLGQGRPEAFVTLSGPDSNAGTIRLTTTESLWEVLGASTTTTTSTSAEGVTTTTYGDITTTIPAGDTTNNPILRYYVVVTDAFGKQSTVSLGEIDPFFVGPTASDSVTLTLKGHSVSLEFAATGASGRDLTDVTHIELRAAPAASGTSSAPATSSLVLTGHVANPGSYTLARLEAFESVTAAVSSSDAYTGVPLFAFLNPTGNPLSEIVVAMGSDGYEVVFSLAELDPSLGGNNGVCLECNSGDLLAYADNDGHFPEDGVARTLTPEDISFAHGRWDSDVAWLDVHAVPEPSFPFLPRPQESRLEFGGW